MEVCRLGDNQWLRSRFRFVVARFASDGHVRLIIYQEIYTFPNGLMIFGKQSSALFVYCSSQSHVKIGIRT